MFRRPERYVLSIFLLGLVLRLYFSLAIDVVSDPGELQYNALAVQGGLDPEYAPLYPLFLRLVYRLFEAFNVRALYVIQSVASAFVVPLMYTAVSRVCGRRTGLIAALISALYPGFILYNHGIITESWSVLLVASMMALAAAAPREPLRTWVPLRAWAHGAMIGVGVLLKPAYVFFLPGFLLTTRRMWFILLAGFLVVVAPLAVRNSLASRHFVPVYSAKSYDMNLDFHAYGSWRMVDLVYDNTLLLFSEPLRWNPGENVRGPVGSETEMLAIYYVRKYSYLVLLWLGLIGLARCVRREHVAVALPVLGAVILPILFTRVTEPRFRVFLEPLLIMYVSLLFGRGRCSAAQNGCGAGRVGS